MTLDSFDLINIACEAFTVMLMLVLVLGMAHGARTRKRRLLVTGMLMHMVTVSADLVANFSDGRPGLPMLVLAHTSNAISYVMGIVTCLTVTAYVYTDPNDQRLSGRVTNSIITTLWGINAFNLLLVLTNPWTHLYYLITEHNEFVWGPWCWLPDILYLIQVLAMVPVVFKHRSAFDDRATQRLMGCAVLVTAGITLSAFDLDLALLYPAIGLSFVMLCVGVQARLEAALVEARAESAESRVRLLSGQIRPHFVFNSLAAIKALVSEDPEAAETAIQDFSDYLRSHLDVMSKDRLVPFEQELDHVRHYVALEQADASAPIEVRYDLRVTDFSIPPLVVQPLVENAVRHGVKTRAEGGTVVVATRRTGDAIEVSVRDDGCGFSSATERQDEHRQVGIENVRERIERQCAGRLEVASGSDGTVATLVIPMGGAA